VTGRAGLLLQRFRGTPAEADQPGRHAGPATAELTLHVPKHYRDEDRVAPSDETSWWLKPVTG
jgi:hypothetical protein